MNLRRKSILLCDEKNMRQKRVILLLFNLVFLAWGLHGQTERKFFVSSAVSTRERAAIYFMAAQQEMSVKDAESFYLRAYEEYKRALQEDSPAQARTFIYLRLAECSQKLNLPVEQADYLNKALETSEELLESESKIYTLAVLSVASQCVEAHDYSQAYTLLKKVRENARKDNISECLWLAVMSQIEFDSGRFRRAVNLRRRVVRKSESAYKQNNTAETQKLYVDALQDMASLGGNYAACYYKKAYEEYVRVVYSELNKKTEVSRSRYWGGISSFFNEVFDRAAEMPAQAYDAALLTKGLLLNSSIDFQNYVANSGDSTAVRLQKERNLLIQEGAPVAVVDSLDNLIIARFNGADNPFKEESIIHWRDVRRELNEDDLAIEFYTSGEGKYGALLLKKDWRGPLNVEVEPDLTVWNRHLRRYFPKTEKGRVFFSPAGALNLRAIEYLPCEIRGLESKCMAEVYRMYRLSSTRELVLQRKEKERKGIVIMGGSDYSADYDKILKVSDSLNTSRRIDREYEAVMDNLHGHNPEHLPWSAREAHTVDSLMSSYGYNVDLFTGKYASEEAVSGYAGKGGLLHVATHGYYVSADETQEKNYYVRLYELNPELMLDPLSRSGLQFAGAEHVWDDDEDSVTPGHNDGILTAREIALMDLSKVEMVVLSSCESGQGDLSGDGVYGLPRAFKKAGAGTILMSLNPIYEGNYLPFLMNRFYQNQLLGKDRQTAFLEAIQAIRAKPEWNIPEIWQAFILLDALPGD